jgi:uncharacterized membrane protein
MEQLVKLDLLRGILIAAIGIILVVIGANLFDNSYESVEQIMKIKHNIIEDQIIMQNQSLNSTISKDELVEHNVILVHIKPTSDSVKLLSIDASGETFEKESKNGFVYHIIEKKPQAEGNYSVTIFNQSNEPVTVNAILGEDPYLSGKCDQSYEFKCDIIPMSIGFVILGVIIFIVGILLAFADFRKQKNLPSK